jgi:naringenin degradation protein FdeE
MPVRDVLIVGGGIAGLAAAIALGERGVRCTVVDQTGGAVGASIVITHRAVYALEELGVLERILEVGRQIKPDEPSWWTFLFNAKGEQLPVPEPVLRDWTVPSSVFVYRPLLADILTDRACATGTRVLVGESYAKVEQRDGGVEVELTTGERGTFDLLVAADGINSGLRDRFFTEVGGPNYTGSMCFRLMFRDAPEHWLTGLHVANTTIATTMLPGRLFYMGVPAHMERRRVEQDEAREIVKSVFAGFAPPSRMFAEATERLTDDVPVIVAPYEWIFVPPPWHRGRIVLVGDAAHATAPTIGSAGGMALEDAVVLAEELSGADDLDAALLAYARRREDRAKLVVETSAALMRSHQERRPAAEEAEMRLNALQRLAEPY